MSEHIFQSMNEHMLDSNNIARWCRFIDTDDETKSSVIRKKGMRSNSLC